MDKNLKLFGMQIFLQHGPGDFSSDSSPETSAAEKQGPIHEERATDDLVASESDSDPKTPPTHDSMNDKRKAENGDKSPKTKLKRPDKILPCPRCNSADTKFCYYNNYNINQPRHFCRSCQRYWTAGGTMRNVPVGAGRRKSKSSSSNCQHITVSEALLAGKIDACNGFHCIKLEQNGTVLSFGSESAASGPVGATGKRVFKNVENPGKGSNPEGFRAPVIPNVNGFPVPGQGIPWNFPVIPIPVIVHPPYYTIPENSSIPWPETPSPAANRKATTVGKHSRDGEAKTTRTKNVTPVLFPKTLRIDDPADAAKSTIWTTLGINQDSLNRKSLFQALQPKTGHENKAMPPMSPALMANPSALSRSTFFHESA